MANWALLPGVGVSAGTSAVFFGDDRETVRRAIGDDLLGDLRAIGRYDRYAHGIVRYDDEDLLDWIEIRSGSLRCEAIDLLLDPFEDVARYCAVRDGRPARWANANIASSTELGICVGGVQHRGERDPAVGWVGVGVQAKRLGQVALRVTAPEAGQAHTDGCADAASTGSTGSWTEQVPAVVLDGSEYRLLTTPAFAAGCAKSDVIVCPDDSSYSVAVRGDFFGIQIGGSGLDDPYIRRRIETAISELPRASVDAVQTSRSGPRMSGSVPTRVGLGRLRDLLDRLTSDHALRWWPTNVYAADGTTELGWWHRQ